MIDAELNEILTSYRDAINMLIERIDAQDSMVNALKEQTSSLEKMVFDDVINPAKQAMEEEIYNSKLKAFGETYADKFNGYNDTLKPIEGEDFDIVKQAFDGYNAIEGEKPEESVYIDELLKSVDAQIDEIRKAIGVPEDVKIEIKSEGDGSEPKIEVEKEIDAKGAEVEKEEPKVDSTEDEVIIEEDEEQSDPEELAKYEEELLKMTK